MDVGVNRTYPTRQRCVLGLRSIILDLTLFLFRKVLKESATTGHELEGAYFNHIVPSESFSNEISLFERLDPIHR